MVPRVMENWTLAIEKCPSANEAPTTAMST